MKISNFEIDLSENAQVKKSNTTRAKGQLRRMDTQQSLSFRKKQKSHYEPEQDTENNDVNPIAGISVEEEEQKIFTWGERSRALSQEETTFLQKNALQRKLEKISSVENILLESSFKYQFFEGKYSLFFVVLTVSICGIKSRTKDVEHCLSLCVEVRLHGLISKLIKMSKKKRSLMLSTAEVQHCVVISNQELWKKEIMRDKEFRGEIAANVDRNKDIKCAEPSQENKMKRTADETLRSANRAARAAAGWDDITSKWKFMGKPERKKQETSSSSHQESQRKGTMLTDCVLRHFLFCVMDDEYIAGTVKGFEPKITIKDIIALLEREPLMSKSTLNYCLCNR
ncbi:unnamed protein product [Fraxinus pennsylvanica]|uniref:Transcription initiation factor TFIID component TAF4 C-terminal domain-containing protein n=1 Tax=Fraxinus pennsylvanica TaxID=56036 RepID=A0AAD2E0B1_9LAMI|nr:unnamed protein product [Fraxinus pennsylvanica]